MRILLATNYQPPHTGGIQFAAESLKQCWLKEGHEVTWISTDIPRGARESTPDNVRIRATNFLERWQCYTPLIEPLAYRHIARLVKEHDVVNVHSVAPTLSLAVLHAALRHHRPTVVTQHVGVIPMKSARQELRQQQYISGIAKWAVRNNAYLTFVGRGVRDWFVDHASIPPDRVCMTPAGIDQHVYYYVHKEERTDFRRKWQMEDGRLSVLFVGRFLDTKGIPLLKELIERCPEVQFTLLGNGPRRDPFSWNLPNARIIESVSTEELRELYGCHDLLIIPSVGEGWPAVICQGMACGLPCIVSEEAFEGYQEDEDRFLVRPRDADALVETLRAAAAGDIPLVSQRWEVSDYAHKHWDWGTTAHIYLKLFERVAAE